MSKNIKNKGFTIVELLVVIVVIGILAAITVVSYTGVSDRAKASANKSNAQSIISAAEAVRADSSSYPAPSNTPATMTGYLNASVAKVPSSISVTGQYTAQPAQTPAVIMPTATNNAVLYVTNNATITSVTGVCVYYYDNAATTPGVYAVTSGSATAVDRPANALAATCTP